MQTLYRKILPLFFSVFAITILSHCQKAPINGHLDGQWQVMEVYPTPETIIDQRLYYCFYMHTCMLTYYGGEMANGNFQYSDNYLQMDFPHPNILPAEPIFKQYGINSNPVTFSIETLTKDKLVLKDGETTVTLRKF